MDHVHTEERKPTEQEDPHNQTQSLNSLPFFLQRVSFHTTLDSSAGGSPHGALVNLKLPSTVINCMDPPSLFLGSLEDFPIGKQHETHGNEEGHSRGCKGIGDLKRDQTDLSILLRAAADHSKRRLSVRAEGDAQGGDDQRQNPAEQQQHGHTSGRHTGSIVQRVAHCYVPVQCYAAEIKNGGCTEGDIEQEMCSAEAVPKVPAVDGPHQTKRHHQHGNQEVCHCQGDHESIGGRLEALETGHCSHDEKISHDGDDGDGQEQEQHTDVNSGTLK